MKKLIELLNEYDSIQYHKINHKIEDGNIYRNVGGTDEWCQIFRYSKQFGLIKWLVENDKINKDLISRVLRRAYVSPETLVSIECEFYDYYVSLLMILSIQDDPIEFLISVLK